jgi:large subunit ribosomal protein L29
MKNKEINKLSSDELENKLHKIKKDLFNMRFKKSNGPLEDTSKLSLLKKDVAKIFTKVNKKK